MQNRTITTVSDRLRGILTSFIGQDRNCPASPVCEAHDRDAFIERVHSFRSSSWFAKPHWLSPVICARYGWINVDVDLLRCVGCQSVLVVRAPSSFDPAIYSACQKRLEDQLKQAAHHPCCIWPGCPTPEVIILTHGNSSSQAAVVEDFINKALLLYSLGTYLPAIDPSALNITESDVAELCSLVRNIPEFPHDNESPAAVQSAVLLALVGWNLSDGDRALDGCTSLQCSICMRQPGLWNYISIVSSDDQICCVDSSIIGDPQLDYQTNAVPEVEHLPAADNHSPFDVIVGQHLSYEIDGMPSAVDEAIVPAAVKDSLPLVTSAKCLDLQKSLASPQSVDAINDTPDVLPNINELCSLAVNSDTDGNCDCITDDMQGVTDTDKHEDSSVESATTAGSFSPSESKNSDVVDAERFPGMTESVGDNENVACDRLQETDVTEQEPGPADIGLTAETEAEQSKDDSDALDVCPEIEETSYLQETELEAAVSDMEETVSESADILTASNKQAHSCEPCEHVTYRSTDEVTCSDNVEEDVCDGSNTEDISCASVELACTAVNDDMNTPVEFPEEAVHESEIMLDDESSHPQSLQKKSFDADMQESDGLPQDESLTGVDGDSEDNASDAGVTEDVVWLLTDLIGNVVRYADSKTDSTRKSLKRHATDILVSSSEPERKRLFVTGTPQTVFDPVAEHYLWCPYVSDIVCRGAIDTAHDVAPKPWLRLLRQLVPDPQAALTSVQTSPIPEGIERIRKLVRSWTLPV